MSLPHTPSQETRRRSGIENYILPRNARNTPSPLLPHLVWITQQIPPKPTYQPSYRLDAFVIVYLYSQRGGTSAERGGGHFLRYQRCPTRVLPGCFQNLPSAFYENAPTGNRIETRNENDSDRYSFMSHLNKQLVYFLFLFILFRYQIWRTVCLFFPTYFLNSTWKLTHITR